MSGRFYCLLGGLLAFASGCGTQDKPKEISDELLVRGTITRRLDPEIFKLAIDDIKKEAIYLRSLLPEIIAKNDVDLRNDFFANSGLDHFYIEELEREYFQINQLDAEQLQKLRTGTL